MSFTSERTIQTAPHPGLGAKLATGTSVGIPGHVDSLAIKAEQLHETFELLHDRLAPVLGPVGPDVGGELAQERISASPVSEHLVDVHLVLAHLESRMRDLLDRIEL